MGDGRGFSYPDVYAKKEFVGLLGASDVLTAEDGRKFVVQTWEGVASNNEYPIVNVTMTPVIESDKSNLCPRCTNLSNRGYCYEITKANVDGIKPIGMRECGCFEEKVAAEVAG